MLGQIRDLGTSLGESQVEAAFSRLKMFVPTPHQPILDAITIMSLGQVQYMNLWQVCCMFQACSRMNYANVDLVEALSQVRNTPASGTGWFILVLVGSIVVASTF